MPSVDKFFETLTEFHVEPGVIEKLKSGFPEDINKAKKSVRADFFRQALHVMEQELGLEKTREIFEANGCCKTGARFKASKEFARINRDLETEGRLEKIRKAPYLNMGSPVLDEHGALVVHAVSYLVDGVYRCACPTISRQPTQPRDKNYCYCCAGHFKFHYEIMLDCKLAVKEIVTSPLDSEGENPCVIKFEVL